MLLNEKLEWIENCSKKRTSKRMKMSKLCVFLTTCIAVSSSTFFGLIQVPGATGALNTVFEFYWNVPTFMCHRYGMFFDEVPNFGIKQNRKDQFKGDKIAILYDPGVFPALLKDENGRTMKRNGGVPQEGNLTHHLELFRKHVDEQIKDVDFKGLAVIDFESWRPIFRQNWASLAPYRDLSTEIERAKHPSWDKKRVLNEATRRFEKAGRLFMEDTLHFARTLRPGAFWGYYAYPYCYNLTPNVPTAGCDPKVYEENDRLSWMFNLQDVLLPSVYLRASLNKKERMELITGRVKEALRISARSKQASKKQVLSYFWYKYQDQGDGFLDSQDLYNGLKSIKNLGGDGVVIWGSSNDLNTKLKCQQFKDYLETTLGPIVWKLKVGRFSNENNIGEQKAVATMTENEEEVKWTSTIVPEYAKKIEDQESILTITSTSSAVNADNEEPDTFIRKDTFVTQNV